MLIALGGSVDFDDIHDRMAPPPTFAPLPGPWRFATSGYAVVLLAMVRKMAGSSEIQNIANLARRPYFLIVSRTSWSLPDIPEWLASPEISVVNQARVYVVYTTLSYLWIFPPYTVDLF